jgi:tetratricopeptide (TPR) repeat protein
MVFLKQDKIDESVYYLEKISNIDSGAPLVSYISDYRLLEKATAAFSLGRYDSAIEFYRQVNNFFGYVQMGLALSYSRIGRYQESLALLDTVITQSPDEGLSCWALYQAGSTSAMLENSNEAKYYLGEYLKRVPDDDAEFLMGRLLSDEMKFDSANIFFKELPDSVDAFLFYKGRTDYFLGLWASSEEKLLRHREIFPRSSYADRALYIIASINFKREEFGDAISFWQELVDTFPESSYAASGLQGVGDSYFNMGKYGKALESYYRIAQYHPSQELSDMVALRSYEAKYYLGKYPSLVDALRSYVSANPRSKLKAKTSLRIAKLLYDTGQYDQSISELDGIIERNPHSNITIEALILRVQVSRAFNSRPELLNSLRSLLTSENAADYRFYAANELGAFWAQDARHDSAIYYYNLLLDSDTYRENAILSIAGIYYQLGQYKETMSMLERLIARYPESRYLADVYMLESKALKSQGDHKAAINVLLGLTEEITDRADAYMELGDLYFETESFVEARQCYVKACEKFKQNREEAARALLLAGDASVSIGDKPNGREYYLQASMIAESAMLKNQALRKLAALAEE